MFIGHFAPAMVAATHKDSPSLPVLFLGGQLVDWGFFSLLIFGVEKMKLEPGITVLNPFDLYHMPYTHSLLGSALWAIAFGIIVFLLSGKGRNAKNAAVIAALVVVSHWFLDWLVHRPDLTLFGAPPKTGLGLWNHPWIEIPLELGITFGGLALYARAVRPARKQLLTMGALLFVMQASQWFPMVDGMSNTMIALTAFSAYALATWAAWWLDRSRTVRQNSFTEG